MKWFYIKFLIILNFNVIQIFALDHWGGDLSRRFTLPQTKPEIAKLSDKISESLGVQRATGHSIYEDGITFSIPASFNAHFNENDYKSIVKNTIQSATHAQYIIFDISQLNSEQIRNSKDAIYQLEKKFLEQKNILKIGFILNYGTDDVTNAAMIDLLVQSPNIISYLNINGDGIAFMDKTLSDKKTLEMNKNIDFLDLSSISVLQTNVDTFIKYIATCTNLRGIDLSSVLFLASSSDLSLNLQIKLFNQIVTVLKTLPQISFLNISSNDLNESAAKIFSTVVSSFKNLGSINIANNNFGGEGASLFFQQLAKLNNLTFINIESNNLDARHGTELANVLINNPSVEFLGISYNAFGSYGFHQLRPGLNNIQDNLKVFKMRQIHNVYKYFVDTTKIKLEYKQLYFFDLGENYFFTDESVKYEPFFKFPENLEFLKLDSDGLNGKRFTIYENSLENSKKLSSVNLSKNDISSEGVPSLITFLTASKLLNDIDLSLNNFTTTDMLAISKALAKLPQITTLNLKKNKIGNDTIAVFSKYFSKNRHLQQLYLSDVELSNDGVIMLAKALKNQVELEVLDLSFNNIALSGLKALLNTLRNQPHFTTLIFHGNQVDCTDLADLMVKLKFRCQ